MNATFDLEAAIGAPPEAADGAVRPELLTLRSGGQCYALDITAVREIRAWSLPTPLPHAPPSMLGMVNLRGVVLPVMDLALRLGHPRTGEDARNVIIVVQQDARLHGLLVEAVLDIVRPPADQVQDMPQTAIDPADKTAERMFVAETGIVQILALQHILPPLAAIEPSAAP